MEYIDILWLLLRSALDERPADLSSRELSGDDWKEVIALARFNRVSALCCHAVSMIGQRPPRELWLPWVATQDILVQKARHRNGVAHELTAVMRQHGVETLVLKGPRLASCYPHPELREYDDLDVYHLGRHRDADRVVETELGLAVNTDDPHHSTYTYRGVTVENHYTFAHNWHAPSNNDYESVLLQQVPSATFDALFLLRHTASHFAASHATVKSICDWAMFVRAHAAEVEWAVVGRAVEQAGMEPFAAALQQIAAERLGAEAPIPVASIDRTVVQRVEYDITYGEFGQPSHPQSGLSRALWKWRRYRANRWKRRMVYRDVEITMLTRGISQHLRQPQRIVRKH